MHLESVHSATETSNFSGDTISSAHTNSGEVWVCTVTPEDGEDPGSTANTSVTIEAGPQLATRSVQSC